MMGGVRYTHVLRRVSILLIATLTAGLTSCSSDDGGKKAAPKKKGEIVRFTLPKPDTAWDKITAKIKDGKISKTGALQAFALQYDLDIPGVTIPSGSRDEGIEDSGTLVRSWLNEYRDQLTAEQLEVIDKATGPQPNDEVWTLNPTGTPVVTTGAEEATANGAATETSDSSASSEPPATSPAGQHFVSPLVSDEFALATEATVYEMLNKVAAKLGVPVIERGFPDITWLSDKFGQFTNVKLIFSPSTGGNTLMETRADLYGNGKITPCAITVYRSAWAGESVSGGALSDRLRVLIAHEVIHCYQNTVNGLESNPWIDEGTATWGATNLLGISEPGTKSFFGRWLNKPYMQLPNRTYDAVGFWWLAHKNGRDLWGSFINLWADDTTAGVLAKIGVDNPDIATTWAPSVFNRNDLPAHWQTTGVGVPSTPGFAQDVAINSGGGFQDMRDGYSAMNYMVSGVQDEILIIETGAGVLGAHDATGKEEIGFQRGVYCMVQSCICPPKTKLAGQNMAADQLRAPFDLAFYGGSGGAVVNARAYDLEETCGSKKPKDPIRRVPPKGPRGCVAACGGSNGDPHLTTMDGEKYDMQAAGEYFLLKDSMSGLQIQVRQEPFREETFIAMNTAIGVQLSTHTVTAELQDDTVVYQVDGKKVKDLSKIADMINDPLVSLEAGPRGAILTSNNGIEVFILSHAPSYGIQLQVSGDQGFRQRVKGLLASSNEDAPFQLPPLRDGRAANAADEFTAIHEQLAASWLVSEAESILPGERVTPEDFPGFPTPPSLNSTEEKRAAAEARCADIEDDGLREDCIFDVMFGGEGFAENYEQLDSFYTNGAGEVTGSGGGKVSDIPVKEEGAKEVAGLKTIWKVVERLISADVAPDGESLAVVAQLSDTQFELARVDPISGAIATSLKVDHPIGAVVYAADALWTGEQSSTYSDCEVVRRNPASFEEVARIPMDCPLIGQVMVYSTGKHVWIQQTVTNEKGESKVGLAAIDPATNAVGDAVVLPDGLAFGKSQDGAILFWDNDGDGAAAITDGATKAKVLPEVEDGRYLVGDGIWSAGDGFINKIDFDGEQTAEIQSDDMLIFATADSVFVSHSDDGEEQVLEIDSSEESSLLGVIPKNPKTQLPVPLYNDTLLFASKDRFIAVVPIYGDASSAVQLLTFKR